MEVRKLILFSLFVASLFLLWSAWQKEHPSAPATQQTVTAQSNNEVPSQSLSRRSDGTAEQSLPGDAQAGATEKIPPVTVQTNYLTATIDPVGATIKRLTLIDHKDTQNPEAPFVLLDDSDVDWFVAQSGLVGEGLPNHQTRFNVVKNQKAADGTQVLEFAAETNTVKLIKTYTFKPDSYLISLAQTVQNKTAKPIQVDGYYQLVRHDLTSDQKDERGMDRTYFGPAYYTEESKFNKIPFEDILENAQRKTPKALTPVGVRQAWVAVVQHYFVTAWIPASGNGPFDIYARSLGNDRYSIGMMDPFKQIAPNQTATQQINLYAGPQEQKNLEAIAPGFDLVVDYGWLTIIAAPLFWLLEFLYGFVHNWGVAIILLTIIIKLIFFPLTAASQKSMAKMKDVAPRIKQLQELYKDDREKLNKEMMSLYQKEKINPLGGCLPILIQIPVFIALYWVLLSSVEIRHAPFMWWWTDLSAKDPYFVLPVLMGITSFVQTKMNPPPPDPMQAKVMTFLPIIFTVMFLWFPAGLVLYWVVSNTFTIIQQWFLQRHLKKVKAQKAANK